DPTSQQGSARPRISPNRKDSPMKDDIVIVSATRTPVGAFNGVFANVPAHELGKTAIKAALERAGVEAPKVSEVIMGQILTPVRARTPAAKPRLPPASRS